MKRLSGSVAAIGVFGVLALCVAGCASKVTKANYDKIQEGMTLTEVEKLLGEGKQQGDGSGVANQFGIDIPAAQRVGGAETFAWESDGANITVYFVGGKVKTKFAKGL